MVQAEHPAGVKEENGTVIELQSGSRDVLAKTFPGDGSMRVFRLFGIGEGKLFDAKQLESYCNITDEHTTQATVVKETLGTERAVFTAKGGTMKVQKQKRKREAEVNIRSIVEEADKLISENSSTDSKVNREDACKIMLGLTHSWRREVVPPASTWSSPVVGVSEMRNEVVSQGWYGKTADWVPSREGWKKRKPLPVVRQGWSVRDRQAAAITEEEKALQRRWMERYLRLETHTISNIKNVHKANPYVHYEAESERMLGFGLGLTESAMKTFVEMERGQGEGAHKRKLDSEKKKKDKTEEKKKKEEEKKEEEESQREKERENENEGGDGRDTTEGGGCMTDV